MNSTDQAQADTPRDIETPFRVLDDGTAFRVEIAVGISNDGQDYGYRFPVRIFCFDHIVSMGPYFEPRLPLWDAVPGPLTEILFANGISEFIRADAEQVATAWLRYRKRRRKPYIAALGTFIGSSLTNFFRWQPTKKKKK